MIKSKDLHRHKEKDRTFKYPMDKRLFTFSTARSEFKTMVWNSTTSNLPCSRESESIHLNNAVLIKDCTFLELLLFEPKSGVKYNDFSLLIIYDWIIIF